MLGHAVSLVATKTFLQHLWAERTAAPTVSTDSAIYTAGPRPTWEFRRGRRFKVKAQVISSQDSLLGS